jgi:SAM-dependent methyltransferase
MRDRLSIEHTPMRVLHIAPEPSLRRLLGRPNVAYTSVDLFSEFADVRTDVCQLPFGEGSFDALLCNHVLEHVPDDHAALTELRRVLRPRGWALLQSPVDATRASTFEDPSVVSPTERERLFGKDDHVRVYGRDYADRLRNAGFDVYVEEYARELGPELCRRYGLLPDEDIYHCVRPL